MDEAIKHNWEQIVGRFILKTGVVELRLLQIYWNITIDEDFDDTIKKDSFAKKIQRIRKKVEVSDISKTLKTEVLDALTKCSEIVNIRNLVAHNPLSMDVYYDEVGMAKYEPLIRSLRNGESFLTEKDLIRGISTIQKVIERLTNIISDKRLWYCMKD